MKIYRLIFLGLLIAAGAPAAGAEGPADDSVLDLVGRIAVLAEQGASFDAAAIAETAGIELKFIEDESAEGFKIYRSDRFEDRPAPMIEAREIPGRTFVNVEANPSFCADRDDVRRRFGESPEVFLPLEQNPTDTPIHFLYSKTWGKLGFGFHRDGDECLSTVIIEIGSIQKPF